MGHIYEKLERYEPDETTKKLCAKYISFLFLYNSFILFLLICSFFRNYISPYGWLFFMNLYFCVFPVFCFLRNTYVPSLLRFYNWMLAITSIISLVLVFQGFFIFPKVDFYMIIFYCALSIFNCIFCWKVTQKIYDGIKIESDMLRSFSNVTLDGTIQRQPRNFSHPANLNFNRPEVKKEETKTFIGQGKTINNANYVKV